MRGQAGVISYGSGAFVVLIFAAGLLFLLSGAGLMVFDLRLAVGALLTVFGGYSLLYSVVSRERVFHLLWGGISVVLGVGLAAAEFLNPLVVLGLTLIFVAVVGAFAITRKR